ncbi:MAG: 4-(cytidine 5'-diphospho)-2-C-methyl-D-erythritol kinase [Tepidimonas sp.]|uniref:4-(cytidine 5'-diphospho)-2-C-methyl-D-erythritol kinase n=1 Tax=Tepidimonas sp. TaxID=2002775 RepID=UPI00298EF9D6|nr:4-(cytidine 5'-diphospho)-2-C-methyl-D-erythritol kinase [Tepidimonas sp.]MCS6810970.1 4-(cytidine 5'-diphospho)-2-C-methyl-D-erythritol kinase [Tepidimonas sp.]MCX7742002.1 4-(cytidine 5'-diphospho)-2-C-methyl-D-erythritol kinase [Tepidimonas sp.]MDW8335678.1 4-(cytidine 5'-diphospho)-2-C-methyl-D-erythritol kinase [Tepidimonas sp.]
MPMPSLLDLPAPAKVNLFLHVVGRRADGYHELQSLFVPLDWADRLHLHLRHDGRLVRHDLNADIALPADDLCLRAARALQQASGCALGADIVLDKRLPQQAGLGGGSSDAATVLLGLNRLWGLRWPRERLAQLGATLGADVPFFLGTGPAWVEGIGEHLQAVELPPVELLVVKPAQGVPTAAIFGDPALPRATPRVAAADALAALRRDPWLSWGRNDLQESAVRHCPAIGQALQRLQALGLRARMSGSGSAVFAVWPAGWHGPDPLTVDWPADWVVRRCRTLATLPLAAW